MLGRRAGSPCKAVFGRVAKRGVMRTESIGLPMNAAAPSSVGSSRHPLSGMRVQSGRWAAPASNRFADPDRVLSRMVLANQGFRQSASPGSRVRRTPRGGSRWFAVLLGEGRLPRWGHDPASPRRARGSRGVCRAGCCNRTLCADADRAGGWKGWHKPHGDGRNG